MKKLKKNNLFKVVNKKDGNNYYQKCYQVQFYWYHMIRNKINCNLKKKINFHPFYLDWKIVKIWDNY